MRETVTRRELLGTVSLTAGLGVAGCLDSLGGSASWPDSVTTIPGADGTAVEGSLGDGQQVSLNWADDSSVACFPGTENDKFNGNHVFFALEETPDSHRELSFTVSPDADVEMSIYSYMTKHEDGIKVPPDVDFVRFCEAAHAGAGEENPGEAQTTPTLFTQTIDYHVFVGVAGAHGATAGEFTLTVQNELDEQSQN